MKIPAGVVAGLDAAINRYLRLDPETRKRMSQLDVGCIAIEFRGLGLTLYAQPHPDGLQITDHFDGTPDTTLSGTPLGLTQLGFGQNRERALFSGAVEISGDVQSGQAFQEILEGMDIDWEEHLARVTGDMVAHNLGNAARRAGELFRRGRATARLNTTEYLQEELRVLPAHIEIDNFFSDVTTLAMDVDRLAAHVTRLQKKIGAGEQA